MKFSTAIIATTFLATSVLAVPAAEKREAAPEALLRAGRFNNWCVGPGQMCYKSKRDLEQAATDILDGYYATSPEDLIEKREASPRKPLLRAGRFNNWCVGPGQMCYKTKRDLDDAAIAVLNGQYATDPDTAIETVEKREASPGKRKPLLRAGRFNNWCVGPGQMCYKSKRDFDHAVDHVIAGFEAPSPEDLEIEKREASPRKPLLRAGRFNNWCVGPGQMCYKSKRDFDEATSLISAGYEAPIAEE